MGGLRLADLKPWLSYQSLSASIEWGWLFTSLDMGTAMVTKAMRTVNGRKRTPVSEQPLST